MKKSTLIIGAVVLGTIASCTSKMSNSKEEKFDVTENKTFIIIDTLFYEDENNPGVFLNDYDTITVIKSHKYDLAFGGKSKLMYSVYGK